MTKDQIRQQIATLKIKEGSEGSNDDNTIYLIIAVIATAALIYLGST
jgi:hypothetical protein